jgi:hypothetical protein
VSRRGILVIGLGAALVYAGVAWTRANVEVVTLHVSGGYTDHYPRVFIVDDPPAVWVRAERRDRRWLDALRSYPDVVVHRGGGHFAYRAQVLEGDGDLEHVDRLFRAKYGEFDRVAAWIWRRNAVQIRLEPRHDLADSF